VATITRPLTNQQRAAELNVIARKQRSLWGDAWYRLTRNKAAMAGIAVIGLMFVVAITAGFDTYPFDTSNAHPILAPYDPRNPFTADGKQAPVLADPVWAGTQFVDSRYLFGTDNLGRDILSRLIYSARVSLIVGFIPVTIVFLIGASVGMLAGYVGKWVDQLLMRVTDVIYAFPDLLFLLILVATLRNTDFGNIMSGLVLIFVGLAIVGWVGMARLWRGQVLSLKEKEFIEAARAIGASPLRIMTKHLFPNALAPALVAISFGIPGAMLAEAGLSFIGIGVKPPTPTWGVMINEGFLVFSTSPWPVMLPAVCIAIVMLSFTFLGDGLRDALDPRMKT
jgi:oligopeptide transport system permease protein